jgi:DNA recombination protein RmuC
LDAPSDEIRADRLRDHARQVHDHIVKLGAKAYWDAIQPTPEFVVMFIPGEAFYSAALEQNPSLIELGVDDGVILATPTMLIALLKSIAYGWREERLAENAQRISELGRELHERIAMLADHFGKVGLNLGRAVGAYNDAVGCIENRVLVTARRFKELGVAGKTEVEELTPIDRTPRELSLLLEIDPKAN